MRTVLSNDDLYRMKGGDDKGHFCANELRGSATWLTLNGSNTKPLFKSVL